MPTPSASARRQNRRGACISAARPPPTLSPEPGHPMRRLVLPFCAPLLLAACDGRADADPGGDLAAAPPADTVPAPSPGSADSGPSDAAGRDTLVLATPDLLTLPYVAEGACPFECCTYREWRATAEMTVRREPSDTAQAAFTLAAGEAFRGLDGRVVVTEPGVVAVRRRIEPEVPGQPAFTPGDTLYPLDHLGEGWFRVWYRGRTVETSSFSWAPLDAPPATRDSAAAVVLRDPTSEWWARVRNGEGRTGWLRMDGAPFIEGVDACG